MASHGTLRPHCIVLLQKQSSSPSMSRFVLFHRQHKDINYGGQLGIKKVTAELYKYLFYDQDLEHSMMNFSELLSWKITCQLYIMQRQFLIYLHASFGAFTICHFSVRQPSNASTFASTKKSHQNSEYILYTVYSQYKSNVIKSMYYSVCM